MGTKLLPGDIIAPLYNFYPCRLWGKPKEVNVGLHVGNDDLKLKNSRSRLRVQGFDNLLTYDSMTFHVAIIFSTIKNVEIEQRHIPLPQGVVFSNFQGFGLDLRISCNPKP
jgi:hypothetical protein